MTAPVQVDPSAAVETFRQARQTDIYIYSGPIERLGADQLLDTMATEVNKQPNASLFLSTYGGDPDGAFRIIRALKRVYSRVVLYVFGYCKSAGTLIALGADEVVMSAYGELGPLDIQLAREDEFFGRTSGLDIVQAMHLLNSQATTMFEQMFTDLLQHTGGQLSTKTVSDVATNTVVGLLAPIFQQIDPIRLGSMNRANAIAHEYGTRLCNNTAAVQQLVLGYPSHGFVVDLEEAQRLLGKERVRSPHEDELRLSTFMGPMAQFIRNPAPQVIVSILRAAPQEDPNVRPPVPESQGDDHLNPETAIQENDGGRPIHGEENGASLPPSPDESDTNPETTNPK